MKKRKRRLNQDGERDHKTLESRQPSIQEIDNNGLIGPYQELPDSGKAELVGSFAPVAHELMTRRPSDITSSLRNHASRSKYITFASTDTPTQSWTSFDTSSDVQCVNIQKPEKINLDRSLPPTPISESPQVGPVTVNFNGATAPRRTPDAFDETSSASGSICVAIAHVSSPTHLNAWQRRFAHLSYASMDMEIVVPPGVSEVEIIQPLNVAKKSEECCGNFF